MKNLLFLGVLCLLASCEWLPSKDAKTQKLVEEEMQQIDWNDLDQYPLFSDCDETSSKMNQRRCFQENILLHFSMTLQDFEFVLNKDVNDTLFVDFLMDKEGTVSVLNIQKDITIDEQMPEFDEIITQSLKSLPKVEPALKRGIPVNAKFRIPIVLNTKLN
ncbi:energy transducer TonB [Costertonia aggregata]|uniref:TonB C-terminal domain-containing protein n=1 Tax=Costertonia aggregata TaxID=343403 RepID=A0A7H9AMR5_9FLAO|nr:hypothetical protein [Costertonia aggregata]QLG44663.1 hypothetical protein HYG79_04645 [Costertonia aggregata]